jgi:hypothetical protein
VTQAYEGTDGGGVNAGCPVHGQPRDQALAPDHVDWAGLPINLDLAFSRKQRDKVYVQHLLRKRVFQLSRPPQNGGQPCGCDTADQVQSLRLRADTA